jgi:acyl carrier protein
MPAEAKADKLQKDIYALIAQQLCVDESEITLESDFMEDLGADSLDQVELLMEVENKYELSISDEDAEKMRMVKDLVEYVRRKQ